MKSYMENEKGTDRLSQEIASSFNYTQACSIPYGSIHLPISNFHEPNLPSVTVKKVTCPRLASVSRTRRISAVGYTGMGLPGFRHENRFRLSP